MIIPHTGYIERIIAIRRNTIDQPKPSKKPFPNAKSYPIATNRIRTVVNKKGELNGLTSSITPSFPSCREPEQSFLELPLPLRRPLPRYLSYHIVAFQHSLGLNALRQSLGHLYLIDASMELVKSRKDVVQIIKNHDYKEF